MPYVFFHAFAPPPQPMPSAALSAAGLYAIVTAYFISPAIPAFELSSFHTQHAACAFCSAKMYAAAPPLFRRNRRSRTPQARYFSS
jgi:hypothetical protein